MSRMPLRLCVAALVAQNHAYDKVLPFASPGAPAGYAVLTLTGAMVVTGAMAFYRACLLYPEGAPALAFAFIVGSAVRAGLSVDGGVFGGHTWDYAKNGYPFVPSGDMDQASTLGYLLYQYTTPSVVRLAGFSMYTYEVAYAVDHWVLVSWLVFIISMAAEVASWACQRKLVRYMSVTGASISGIALLICAVQQSDRFYAAVMMFGCVAFMCGLA